MVLGKERIFNAVSYVVSVSRPLRHQLRNPLYRSKRMSSTPADRLVLPSNGGFISYEKYIPPKPSSKCGVIFCQGLMSNMRGTKATFLKEYCKEKGLSYVRFDYQGHGESSGDFSEVTISLWKENTLAVLRQLTEGPQVIVGSSIGGWIMLLVALEEPSRIKSLVGIASAPDMLYRRYENLSAEEKAEVERKGYFNLLSEYDNEPYIISLSTLKDAAKNVLLNSPIKLNCPVTLIHGMNDQTIPYQTSVRLAEKLTSKEVQLILEKDGDHRMSKPKNLRLLADVLDKMIF